jgi:uncharacterized damage-inducible protein DinB
LNDPPTAVGGIRFLYQGNVVMERPTVEFLWDFMFDAIHHRGQLSAYLRPMGAKVPSIYGPSADDADRFYSGHAFVTNR